MAAQLTQSLVPAIHLIRKDPALPAITPVRAGSNFFRSGCWALPEDKARALIGGNIFFHEKQTAPSFYGGVITDVEKIKNGDWQGRIIFTFRFDQACRGVKTTKTGWSQEMKIVLASHP